MNSQIFFQHTMGHKVLLKDILKVKQRVDHMDLREFKLQWRRRSTDYLHLDSAERLKYMVMSIKILQAKTDLKRMISSVKELSSHPEPHKAIYYYFRSNLWKFLDHFRYILLVDDIPDDDKLECLAVLDEYAEIIGQDEELTLSCVNRLRKLLEQNQLLEQDLLNNVDYAQENRINHQLAQRIAQLIQKLTSSESERHAESSNLLSTIIQEYIQTYSSFSVSRISIQTSGVLSIIQLLSEHPLTELREHRRQLQSALELLEQKTRYDSTMRSMRNQCAYALIVLQEIVKMHHGLPVLLLRLLELGAFIQFPPSNVALNQEIQELQGKITDITQHKLRPIIEDVLWKNPTFLTKLPHIRMICPWCYRKDRPEVLHIKHIRRIMTASLDLLEDATGMPLPSEGTSKSHLSELVIDILGLFVNLEPSPRFLKAHTQEAQKLKSAKKSNLSQTLLTASLEKQYATYKSHLQFLEDSIEYYVGIAEKLEER